MSALARAERIEGGEVALVFVDDSYIRELKGRYLGKHRATDVLAFPLPDDQEVPNGGMDKLIGEVYVSTERAIDQARRNHVGLSQEIARLIVHGMLHLFGYKDDTRSSRRAMIRRQESFLRENRSLAADVATRMGGRGRPRETA